MFVRLLRVRILMVVRTSESFQRVSSEQLLCVSESFVPFRVYRFTDLEACFGRLPLRLPLTNIFCCIAWSFENIPVTSSLQTTCRLRLISRRHKA